MTFRVRNATHFPCGCPRTEENTYRGGSRGTKRCLYHTRLYSLQRTRRYKRMPTPMSSRKCILADAWKGVAAPE